MKPQKPKQDDPRDGIPSEYKPAEWLIKSPHRPPNSTTAISHRDVLYAVIGRVLTAWELLETVLAGEFKHLIGATQNSAMRAYGSILASGSRCDMLLAAAEIELAGADLKRFEVCIQDVRRLAAVRNLVAHGIVVSQNGASWISDDPRSQLAGPFMLMPAPYNKSKFSFTDGPSYMYSLDTVEKILEEVQKMQARAGSFGAGGSYNKFTRIELN